MSRHVRRLRERLTGALQRGELADALSFCAELEKAEPEEPRWPHRTGDVLRRMDRDFAAVEAYGRAVDLYAAQGYLARAVAMAKVVLGIDPERLDILQRVDPEAAKALHRTARVPTQPVSRKEVVRSLRKRMVVVPDTPAFEEVASAVPELKPAADATDDEVRFEDVPSIELDLSELDAAAGRPSYEEISVEAAEVRFDDDPLRPSAEQLAQLPGSPVFAELPRDVLVELGRQAELVEAPDGAIIVKTGDPADSLFVIAEGMVRVNVPATGPADDATLAEGDVFGESCLLESSARQADVIVRGSLTALEIQKSVIDEIVESHPAFGEVMFDLFTRRIVANLLQTSPVFAGFDQMSRRELGKLFEARRAAPGQVIVKAGKRSDAMYVLLSGSAELTEAEGDSQSLRPVVIIGQSSLVSREPPDFTVTTRTDALLLRLPCSGFSRAASDDPFVQAHLEKLARDRVPSVIAASSTSAVVRR